MEEQDDKPTRKPAPSSVPKLSKRGMELDKLIAEHCRKHGKDREIYERAHAREFNERSRFLPRNDMCAIDGILANDPRELMICFVAQCEGLAKVHGFNYSIIRADDA